VFVLAEQSAAGEDGAALGERPTGQIFVAEREDAASLEEIARGWFAERTASM